MNLRSMNLNPVFQTEVRRNSRSVRISWIVFGGNLLLAVIAAICFFGAGDFRGYVNARQYLIPIRCHMPVSYTHLYEDLQQYEEDPRHGGQGTSPPSDRHSSS